MRLIGLLYFVWPVIAWTLWGGMTALGYSGWWMDLLFIGAIAITAGAAILAVVVSMFMKNF